LSKDELDALIAARRVLLAQTEVLLADQRRQIEGLQRIADRLGAGVRPGQVRRRHLCLAAARAERGAGLDHGESLPAVNSACKPYQGECDNSLFTEESEPRLRWLGLVLHLSVDPDRYLDEFQQILALPV